MNITHDELKEAMREHGVENFKDLKLAMLEIDGNISIISGINNLTLTYCKRKHNRKIWLRKLILVYNLSLTNQIYSN